MSKSDLDDQLRIERYILRQMNEEEAADFEAHFLGNQECLEQLVLAEKLYEGLKLQDKSEVAQVSHFDSSIEAANESLWWKKAVPLWRIVAVLIVVVLPINIIYLNSLHGSFDGGKKREVPNSGQYGEIVSLSLTDEISRGVEQTLETVVINSDANRNILAFYVEPDAIDIRFTSYWFRISDIGSKKEVYKIENLILNDKYSEIYVVIGNRQVDPGTYVYEMFGMDLNGKNRLVKDGSLVFR